jgi:diguanylate cyclase (GGDEF)-like protein/PAS domain S-box-containing protein
VKRVPTQRRGRVVDLVEANVPLRSVVDNLPAMIGYWDRDLRNVMGNTAYVEWFGLTPEEMRGKHIREVLGEELFALNEPYMRRALAGEAQLFDRTIIDASGQRRHTQASYIPDIREGEVHGFFVLVTDITQRKVAEDALADETERMRTLLDAVAEGVVSVDLELRVDDVNLAAVPMTGVARAAALGRPVDEVVHIEVHVARVPVGDICRAVERTGQPHQRMGRDRLVGAQGHSTSVDWAVTPVRAAAGDVRGVLLTLRDVGGPRRLLEETAQRALHDPLTGLKNRRFLEQLQGRRHGDVSAPAVAVFLDLDGFKGVNDTAGHAAGDAVLIQVSDELRLAVRESDALVRLGGDEFAIVLSDCTLLEGVELAQNIVDQIEGRTFAWHGSTFRLGVSAGVAVEEPDGQHRAIDLIERADAACYRAKRAGGHQVAIAD